MTEVSDRAAEVRSRRVPGVEARAGKFPGPSLIPALNAIQARLGWLPREELEELARDARRPRYEIEGLISFYPHFRTDAAAEGGAARLPRPVLLAARRRGPARRAAGALRRGRRRRAGRGVLPGPLRHRPGGRGERAPGPVERRRTRWSPAPAATASGDARRKTRDRAVAERPLPGRVRGRRALRHAARAAGRRARRRTTIVATLKDSGLRGMGGAGFPTGQKWELVRGAQPGDVEVRDLQRRRVRAGHLQGPPDPGHPAAPGAGGPAAGHGRGRRRAGLGLHPPRVRPRGARPARRDRRAARGRRHRAGRLRQRAAAGRRGVRLPRRLHPRRGDRAAGVHGGPPRRAAQQAAVPRQLRPARPPDADQLGRDLRRRAGDRAARRAVVGRAGRRRVGRAGSSSPSPGTSSGPTSTACRWAPPSAS